MELTGKVKVVTPVQQITDSYKKRELVITTDEQYPQHINIEFGQDKTDLLNGLSIGQEVKVHINIGGREWTNPQGEVKYFNSIKGWKVEKLSSEPQAPATQSAATQKSPFPIAEQLEQEHDDLPF